MKIDRRNYRDGKKTSQKMHAKKKNPIENNICGNGYTRREKLHVNHHIPSKQNILFQELVILHALLEKVQIIFHT